MNTFPRAFPLLCLLLAPLPQAYSLDLAIIGPWDVQVAASSPDTAKTFHVIPPALVHVTAERHAQLPIFNPRAGGWQKGVRLQTLIACETTTPYLLEPKSLIVRDGVEADSRTYVLGQDYAIDGDWGTVGRLEGGALQPRQPVFISYQYTPQRLDSIVVTSDGAVEMRQGAPQTSLPRPPAITNGERRLANVWLPGRLEKLGAEHLFEILESEYPEPDKPSPTMAELTLPQTLKKLRSGEPLRVLAWGDSVTVGSFLPNLDKDLWQLQVVARLRERFPKANIELVTQAWGGRNSGSFLAEPAGSPYNYHEKVLGSEPDLVISEFVNDAGLSPPAVEERYGKLLADFNEIGAEWIILTPHYVRPDWMGLDRERNIDADPRAYVAGLRQFSAAHGVALADASLRWGRLWRQGIPYTTLLMNSINHPDAYGMSLFADAVMEMFPNE